MPHSTDGSNIKIPKTKSERICDGIGYLFYIGSIIFLIAVWGTLPEQVPVHYNALGDIDRWGSKWELLILPGIGFFILLFMQLLEKFPEMHNYPKRLNEKNAGQFYLLSRKLVNRIKNACFIIFSLILFESASIALRWGSGFGGWFLPVIILGIVILIAISVIQQKKIK
ncbi:MULTISPECIES: DUF1648 domain-containing protein [Bacillus]|uniref:DUF1648 domain-containing protein n=1 Tax=Bacillus TaxID=1386 RepID=UPI0004036AD6|nr:MULTISPECIES: DUF1648 domain-containing protein [Bacillus]QHZ48807.1 DUF1648 domain-containing protein [Bacillus sp. NSP9.1]